MKLIRQGSVPTGYKQTEIGVIPADWEASPLPNNVWFQEGPGLRNWQFRPSGLKVINVTNLQENGYLDLSTTERHISWEEGERSYKHFLIDDGDIVIASSGNSYCKVAVVKKSDLPLLMNTSVIRFKAKAKISRSFMLTYLKSKYFKAQIDLMITGGAQPNFGPFHLRKVFIPLPPTKTEQEAIAEVLSDADALIESLELLLTKKRRLKQGTMQELLTGKKRLPGFSGEWKVKRLGEMLSICHGKSQRDVETSDGLYPVLATGGEIGRANRFLYDKPSVLIGRKGTIDQPQYMDTPFWTVDTLFYSVVREPNHAKFIFYRFWLIDWKQYNEASGVPSLNARTIEAIEINSPGPDEQTAIAAILSDMDTEIAALEAKLAKARQLKQGMMQELLTGRIRLV